MTTRDMPVVLKKPQVRMAGRRPVGPAAAPAGPAPAAAPARARILAHDDRGALIEVTCPCGRSVQVHCLYAAPDATKETSS
jgi:hypothetical protein